MAEWAQSIQNSRMTMVSLRLPISLLVLAVGFAVFATWGLESSSGRDLFPEMAGMIPVGAACVAVFLAAAAGAMGGWRLVRQIRLRRISRMVRRRHR